MWVAGGGLASPLPLPQLLPPLVGVGRAGGGSISTSTNNAVRPTQCQLAMAQPCRVPAAVAAAAGQRRWLPQLRRLPLPCLQVKRAVWSGGLLNWRGGSRCKQRRCRRRKRAEGGGSSCLSRPPPHCTTTALGYPSPHQQHNSNSTSTTPLCLRCSPHHCCSRPPPPYSASKAGVATPSFHLRLVPLCPSPLQRC